MNMFFFHSMWMRYATQIKNPLSVLCLYSIHRSICSSQRNPDAYFPWKVWPDTAYDVTITRYLFKSMSLIAFLTNSVTRGRSVFKLNAVLLLLSLLLLTMEQASFIMAVIVLKEISRWGEGNIYVLANFLSLVLILSNWSSIAWLKKKTS